MSDGPEWFAAKRRGLGAGPPIAWQGWAVLAAFASVICIALVIFGPDDPLALTMVLPAIAALCIVIARTTKGGWGWHWGKRE